MLLGKYKKPKEEERILMCVDLKDSAKIAEHLGHSVYSRFIQECYKDLNKVLRKYDAEDYQYVGDEAVLSWEVEEGVVEKHCLPAYFDFMKVLERNKDYYQKKYGLQPFFKAGIHMGKVIVTEVGVVKKEIAYHGDVLNMAARIQEKCNKLGQALLASEVIVNHTNNNSQFSSELMEVSILRGKENPVKIFGITPTDTSK